MKTDEDITTMLDEYRISEKAKDSPAMAIALKLHSLYSLFKGISSNPSVWILCWAALLEISRYHKRYFTRKDVDKILWWIKDENNRKKIFSRLKRTGWIEKNRNQEYLLTSKARYVVILISSLANPDIDNDAMIKAITSSIELSEATGAADDYHFLELKIREIIQTLEGDVADIERALKSGSFLELERIARIGQKHLKDIDESHTIIEESGTTFFDLLTAKSVHELVSKIDRLTASIFKLLRQEYEREILQKMRYITLKDLDIFLSEASTDELTTIVRDYIFVAPKTVFIDFEEAIDHSERLLLKEPKIRYNYNEPESIPIEISELDLSDKPPDPLLVFEQEVVSAFQDTEQIKLANFVPMDNWGQSILRLLNIFRIEQPPKLVPIETKINIKSTGEIERINLKTVQDLTKTTVHGGSP